MVVKWFFHLFILLLVLSSVSVISLRNSIQSIVSLIICFVISSILLLILNCEFFAFLFLIVYVGAIAVLFLFVLMMLELKHLNNNSNNFYQVIACLSVPLIFFLLTQPITREHFVLNPYTEIFQRKEWVFICNNFEEFLNEDNSSETDILGQLLYTRYALQFLLTGLILTLAVLCVGVLTIDRNKNSMTEFKELVVSRLVKISP